MGINLEYAIQNCVVEKSKFSDISANAISIGSADYYNRINWIYPDNYYYLPADEKYYVKNNNICENTIENVAVEYRGAAAVSGGFLIDTDIAYNDISETAYSAIHINWGWNYINTSCTSNVRIHHNYIKNALNSYMADGGAIYVLGPTSGKVRCSINNNYIDGVFSKTNYVYGSALYLDEGASHWDVHSNVINLYETNSTYFTNKNWISSLEENKKENHIYNNFISNYSRHHCDTEVGNYVKNTTICTDLNWTDEALEIISGAGTKGKEGQN